MTDSWTTELSSFDDYVGTVEDAWFGIDPNYNEEAVLLHWEISSTDFENARVEKFPVGKGWTVEDGGKSASHFAGKRFHSQSTYGKIIDRAVSEFGLAETLRARGLATQADVWTGLTFHFHREEFDYGGEIGKRSRVMPIEFLGEAKGHVKQHSFDALDPSDLL